MTKAYLCLMLLLAFAATAFATPPGYHRTYEHEDGSYLYAGAGANLLPKTQLYGFEALFAGRIGNVILAGANASIYQGDSWDAFGNTVPGVDKYIITTISEGFNIGLRIYSSAKTTISVHCLFGGELAMLSYSKTQSCCNVIGHVLESDNFWYVRPALSFKVAGKMGMTASYNWVFNNTSIGDDTPAFATAADFDGPQLSIHFANNGHRHHHYYRGWRI